MLNPTATNKLINCNTCGIITEQIVKQGKVIKNCIKCREANNIKKKSYTSIKKEPEIKYQKSPLDGFYKNDAVLYVDNIKELDNTSNNTEADNTSNNDDELENTELNNTELNNIQQNDDDINLDIPKEKTIKELLTEILIKLDKEPQPNMASNNTPELLETVNVKIENLENIINKQNIQYKILLNKVDTIIKAIT